MGAGLVRRGLQIHLGTIPGKSVGAVGAKHRNLASMRVSGVLGSGGKVGAKWGQSGGKREIIHIVK